MKYIDKLGIEVETCLSHTNFNIPHLYEIKDDGSINIDSSYRESNPDKRIYAMEVVSKPVDMCGAMEFLDGLDEFMDIGGINSSMGFHVHFSLKNSIYYICLFSEDFAKYMLHELHTKMPARFRRIERRVQNNSYCTERYGNSYFKEYYPHRHASTERRESPCGSSCPCYECDDGEDCEDYNEDYYYEAVEDFEYGRYRMINFIDAWHKFGTFEIRMFDSASTDILKRYVKFATCCINKYLDENLHMFDEVIEIPLISGEEHISDSEYLLLDKPEFVRI